MVPQQRAVGSGELERPGMDNGFAVSLRVVHSTFGIIVAGSELNEISYALPARTVFEEIRAGFPEMQLQSMQHIATLPLADFVDIIRKAIELGLTSVAKEMVLISGSLNQTLRDGLLYAGLFLRNEAAVAFRSTKGLSQIFITLP
jgi:hypothetical protein